MPRGARPARTVPTRTTDDPEEDLEATRRGTAGAAGHLGGPRGVAGAGGALPRRGWRGAGGEGVGGHLHPGLRAGARPDRPLTSREGARNPRAPCRRRRPDHAAGLPGANGSVTRMCAGGDARPLGLAAGRVGVVECVPRRNAGRESSAAVRRGGQGADRTGRPAWPRAGTGTALVYSPRSRSPARAASTAATPPGVCPGGFAYEVTGLPAGLAGWDMEYDHSG